MCASTAAEGAPKLGFNEPLLGSQLARSTILDIRRGQSVGTEHTHAVVAAMARQREDIQTSLATGNLASVKPLIDGKDAYVNKRKR